MMPRLTLGRRGFLVACASLIGATTLSTANSAAAADDQFERLRRTWSDILTGGAAVNPADPRFAAAIKRLDADAAAAIALYDKASASVYTDLPFTSGENANATYNRVLATAIAWATPGSRYHQQGPVADRLVAGLKLIGAKYYRPSQAETGNWWPWEIGSPQALVNACAVLGDRVPAADLASHMAAVAHFDADCGTKTTGANRSDKAQISIVRGILSRDAALIKLGRDTLSGTFPYVSTLDGFYRDGSFVYHNTIPYTGHYGFVLLNDLSQLHRLLAGSDFAITDPNFGIILGAVDHAYAPFLRNGLVMDVVRGRMLSRQSETDHDAGHNITEAIIGLIPAGSADQQRRWKALAKSWITGETFAPILASATPARVALVKSIVDDTSVTPAAPAASHLQFPAMARAVHTRASWSWTVGLSGRAVSRFEAINGQNKRGWHTGDGATYLYNNDNGHYTDAYWPTVDCKRLPGTTVDSLPFGAAAGAGSRPPTSFAGGATLGSYGAVALDLSPFTTPMRARKSWFCLDDMVVALGSGIIGGSGHPIETIVENRNLGPAGVNALTVDGQAQSTALGWSAKFAKASWAHVDGVAGYVFPGGAAVNALRQARTGAWSDIDSGADTAGTPTPYTRRYLTMWFDHGTAPNNASYSYLTLPGATAAATSLAAQSKPVTVLANTATQQAIRVAKLGLTAAVFFSAGSVGGITVTAPCVVLTRGTTVTVADPTLTLKAVTVTVSQHAPITFDLTQAAPGTTHQATLS